MIPVLELREQAHALSVDAFVARHGPVAMLVRPHPDELARATLKLQSAATVAKPQKPTFLDELLVMLRAFRTLKVYFFKPTEAVQRFTMGRDASSAAMVDEPSVSKLHASLLWAKPTWSLRDERSLNGTFVNTEEVNADKPIDNGDLITLGDAQLVFIHTSTLHSQLLAMPLKK